MEQVRKVKVGVDGGLHARPAAEVVRLSKTFVSDIQIEARDQVAGARSSLKLIMLSVREGDEVVTRARGHDAEMAVASITAYIARGVPQGGANEPSAPAPAKAPAAAPAVGAAPAADGALRGIAVGGRRAVGPVFRLIQPQVEPEDDTCPPGRAEDDIRRALQARDAVAHRCLDDAQGSSDPATRQVLSALAEMVADADWADAITARIRAGAGALAAVRDTGHDLARALADAPDDYIRARAEDMRSAAELVLLQMQGKRPVRLADAPAGAIIVAEELAAMHLGDTDLTQFGGLVTARGAANGHAAILARSAGLHAVFGLGDDLSTVAAARQVALDGATGDVFPDPSAAVLAAFAADIRRQTAEAEALAGFVTVRPVSHANGPSTVAANIGSVADARRAAQVGRWAWACSAPNSCSSTVRRWPTKTNSSPSTATCCAAFRRTR